VESALEGLDQLAAQEIATQRQRDANAKALAHAQRRFEAGYAAYLEPLDAQRGLFAADLTVTQVREARLLNVIALYQALGGGWRMGDGPEGDD
jgi:outer membrane protein TolC